MIDHGATLDYKDSKGNNLLHIACLNSGSNVTIPQMLLNTAFFDLEETNNEQETALRVAEVQENLPLIELLRRNGAKTPVKFNYNYRYRPPGPPEGNYTKGVY